LIICLEQWNLRLSINILFYSINGCWMIEKYEYKKSIKFKKKIREISMETYINPY